MKVIYLVVGISIVILLFQSYKLMSNSLKTENQKYRTVLKDGQMEIRYYPSATFATIYSSETEYKALASSGFRRLAGYIFGGNDQAKSIPMTAPVRMEMGFKGSSMSFVMPERFSENNLPKPKDSKIQIQQSAPQYVAVISFNGYANDERIRENRDLLLKLIQAKGIQVTGEYSFLGYNAPYQFWGRRNEVVIPVVWKEE
ncbi:MAG: hypothetical protein RLZZ474_447 [Bacteroidota bacterium]|jgi:hypothetical protein